MSDQCNWTRTFPWIGNRLGCLAYNSYLFLHQEIWLPLLITWWFCIELVSIVVVSFWNQLLLLHWLLFHHLCLLHPHFRHGRKTPEWILNNELHRYMNRYCLSDAVTMRTEERKKENHSSYGMTNISALWGAAFPQRRIGEAFAVARGNQRRALHRFRGDQDYTRLQRPPAKVTTAPRFCRRRPGITAIIRINVQKIVSCDFESSWTSHPRTLPPTDPRWKLVDYWPSWACINEAYFGTERD